MTVLQLGGMDAFEIQEAPEALLMQLLQAEGTAVLIVTDSDGEPFYFERSIYMWHQKKKESKQKPPTLRRT